MLNTNLSKELKVANIIKDSIVDGPGLRYVVFTQGCIHNCDNCHNSLTHDINGGIITNIDTIINDLSLNFKYLDGITISGGEPLIQEEVVCSLINEIKNIKDKGILKEDFSIIVYTGYTMDEIDERIKKENNIALRQILNEIDILIDGRFINDKKSLDIKFRGSTNQKVIPLSKLGEELLNEF